MGVKIMGAKQSALPGFASAGRWHIQLNAFNAKPLAERGYLIAFGLGVLGLMLSRAGEIGQSLGFVAFWSAAALASLSLTYEAYLRVVPHAQSLWGRWLMLPVAATVGSAAYGHSSHILNAATGQDPDLFPRSMAFMTSFAAIPLLGIVAMVLLIVGMLFSMLAGFLQVVSNDRARSNNAWIWIARVFSACTAMVFVSPVLDEKSSIGQSIEGMAGWVAQGFDMHVDRTCGPGEWDRVKRINETLVLRVSRVDGQLLFRRVACPLGPDQQIKTR